MQDNLVTINRKISVYIEEIKNLIDELKLSDRSLSMANIASLSLYCRKWFDSNISFKGLLGILEDNYDKVQNKMPLLSKEQADILISINKCADNYQKGIIYKGEDIIKVNSIHTFFDVIKEIAGKTGMIVYIEKPDDWNIDSLEYSLNTAIEALKDVLVKYNCD